MSGVVLSLWISVSLAAADSADPDELTPLVMSGTDPEISVELVKRSDSLHVTRWELFLDGKAIANSGDASNDPDARVSLFSATIPEGEHVLLFRLHSASGLRGTTARAKGYKIAFSYAPEETPTETSATFGVSRGEEARVLVTVSEVPGDRSRPKIDLETRITKSAAATHSDTRMLQNFMRLFETPGSPNGVAGKARASPPATAPAPGRKSGR